MSYHVHIGLIHALIVWMYILIIGPLWRYAASHFSDTAIGKAMAYIY
jgi:hypothetical protein